MKKLLYFILLVPLVLTSCTRDPFANFVADRKIVEVGEEVYFTNRSHDAVDYEWDFGDGYYSYNFNAQHSWAETGIYTVTLTAFGKEGTLDRASITIEVTEPPADLLVIVEEYYEPYYLVEDISVRIYETLRDWDEGGDNYLVEGYTNNKGEVLFLDLPPYERYYIDVWGPNHDNYQLRDEDVGWIETQILEPGLNEFVAVVDYYPEGKKSATVRKGRNIDRSVLQDKEGARKKADRVKPEGIEQETR